jgi:serine/threonine-protein kinase
VVDGRYELGRQLGAGGMARVYLAHDRLLDREVAVKVLAERYASDPAFVERFRREAQAAGKLNHPNIVAVYDYFEEDGGYFIVQEYVDGRSLAEVLRSEGRLHPDRAADVASDIAAALGAAHREGMVHRDIKAGNVLWAEDGQVKVADFGIARLFSGGDSDLTQAGVVMGTATYFSPEQAQGKPVDPRSDLYSLGVVLYEMLVGHAPFVGDDPGAIAYAHVHEQPKRPREEDPELPPEIDAITMKLLAKDPAHRYPSADDLRADLRRYRQGVKLTPPPEAAAAAAGAPAATAPPRPAPRDIDFGSYEDGRYVEPPRRTGFFLLFMIVVMAALAAGLWYLSGILDDEDDTRTLTVPNVVGENREAAANQLRRAGFRVRQRQEADNGVAVDVVIRQNPEEGAEAAERSIVTIVVSAGAETAAVPEVIGQDVFSASQALESAGFVVQVEQREDDSGLFTEGQVWEQSPASGTTAALGSVVIIRVVPASTPTTVVQFLPTLPA